MSESLRIGKVWTSTFLKTEHTAFAKRKQHGELLQRCRKEIRLHRFTLLCMSVAYLFTLFLAKFQPERTSIRLLFKEFAQVLQLLLQLLSVQLDNCPVEEACEFGTQTFVC